MQRTHMLLMSAWLASAACTTTLTDPNPGSTGDDTGSAGSAGSDAGSDTSMPTYPDAHPRILLGTRKADLQAALAANTPAAVRFRTVVDSWIGGNDLGLSAWHAALLGPLTADPKYCAKAIGVVETMVTTAEAAIAAGQVPHAAGDSYYFVGEDIGDLALTYDWCFDTVTANQKTRWLAYADQAI